MSHGEVVRRDQPPVAARSAGEIANVVALFEALAVGWAEGSGRNRYLLAGDGGQFVRVDPCNFPHTFYKPSSGDIRVAVRDHGYNMRGFIQHDADILYPGMFETTRAEDGAWWMAWLTADGFRFAQAPVFDVARLHRDIANCSFFNPSTKAPTTLEVGRDAGLMLPTTQKAKS